MIRLVLTCIGLLVLAPASAGEVPKCLYQVVNVRVIDGDTVKGTIVLPWGVALYDVRIRAATYDAWETTRRRRTAIVTEGEIRRGKEAANALAKLLTDGQLLISTAKRHRDVYGRVLGVLWIERDGKVERLRDWMKVRGYLRKQQQ